ncbi:MAG: hypothetical protein WBQ73_00020 [Candidatus Babeliales bacterium]
MNNAFKKNITLILMMGVSLSSLASDKDNPFCNDYYYGDPKEARTFLEYGSNAWKSFCGRARDHFWGKKRITSPNETLVWGKKRITSPNETLENNHPVESNYPGNTDISINKSPSTNPSGAGTRALQIEEAPITPEAPGQDLLNDDTDVNGGNCSIHDVPVSLSQVEPELHSIPKTYIPTLGNPFKKISFSGLGLKDRFKEWKNYVSSRCDSAREWTSSCYEGAKDRVLEHPYICVGTLVAGTVFILLLRKNWIKYNGKKKEAARLLQQHNKKEDSKKKRQ